MIDSQNIIDSKKRDVRKGGLFRAISEEFWTLFPDPEHARPQQLANGFTWTEGPTYQPSRQAVIFSDVRQNKTWRWEDEGGLHLELSPSHHQNGHCLDAEGRLIACSHGERALLRQEKDGSWTTLADQFEGKKLNSPNDVALHPDGSLWFSDPTYGIDKPEEGYGGTKEQDGNYVFRLDVDGTLTAPIRDRYKPNGLVFASAEHLLLADTGESQTYLYRIEGKQAHYVKQLFDVPVGKTDGLRVDTEGRIWSSSGDGVHVLTAEGERLGHIAFPRVVSNLCFGGPHGTTLYVTATDALWSLETTCRQKWTV